MVEEAAQPLCREVDAGDVQIVLECMTLRRPVVWRSAVAHWPALKKWRSVEYLAQRCAGVMVDVTTSPSKDVCGAVGHHSMRTMPFEQFINAFERRSAPDVGGADVQRTCSPGRDMEEPVIQVDVDESQPLSCWYLAQCVIESRTASCSAAQPLAALRDDIDVPACVPLAELTDICFWASPDTTCASLHFDELDGLLCCVTGEKTAWLLPPSAAASVHMRGLASASPHHADTDADTVKASLRALHGCVACLRPGDALLIPEGWLHLVESAPRTLAVNLWWRGPWTHLASAAPHMMWYYARRALAALVADQRLLGPDDAPSPAAAAHGVGDGSGGRPDEPLVIRLLRAVDQPRSALAVAAARALHRTDADALCAALMHAATHTPRALRRVLERLEGVALDALAARLERCDDEAGPERMGAVYAAMFGVCADRDRQAVVDGMLARRQRYVAELARGVVQQVLGDDGGGVH